MKKVIQRIIPITLAITMCFSINVIAKEPIDISSDAIRKDMTNFVQTMYYEPRERINNVWLYDDTQSPSYRLSSVKDYIVEYKNNQMPGTATITFTGIGDYTGSFSKTFKIVKMPIANITTKASYNEKKALIVSANSGSEDLVYGKDFTISATTDVDGNVTVKFYGTGDRYTGSCTKTIKAKDNPYPAPRSYLKDVVITKHKNTNKALLYGIGNSSSISLRKGYELLPPKTKPRQGCFLLEYLLILQSIYKSNCNKSSNPSS